MYLASFGNTSLVHLNSLISLYFFESVVFLTPPLSFGLLFRGQAQSLIPNPCCFIVI